MKVDEWALGTVEVRDSVSALFLSNVPTFLYLSLLIRLAEAKKLVKSGGFYINNVKASDAAYRIGDKDWIDGAVCVLRSGKSNYKLVRAAP